MPVFITETAQVDPWVDTNNGWACAAYAEIDRTTKVVMLQIRTQ